MQSQVQPQNQVRAQKSLPLEEAASMAADGEAELANASEGQCEEHDERAFVNPQGTEGVMQSQVQPQRGESPQQVISFTCEARWIRELV